MTTTEMFSFAVSFETESQIVWTLLKTFQVAEDDLEILILLPRPLTCWIIGLCHYSKLFPTIIHPPSLPPFLVKLEDHCISI